MSPPLRWLMNKWLLGCAAFLLVVALVLWSLRIPAGHDVKTSSAVARALSQAYGKFVPEDQARRDGRGAVLYAKPVGGFGTDITIYEVTDPNEIRLVERAASQALDAVPAARGITLHFLREQVWQRTAGGQQRGDEVELKTTVLSKAVQAR